MSELHTALFDTTRAIEVTRVDYHTLVEVHHTYGPTIRTLYKGISDMQRQNAATLKLKDDEILDMLK